MSDNFFRALALFYYFMFTVVVSLMIFATYTLITGKSSLKTFIIIYLITTAIIVAVALYGGTSSYI